MDFIIFAIFLASLALCIYLARGQTAKIPHDKATLLTPRLLPEGRTCYIYKNSIVVNMSGYMYVLEQSTLQDECGTDYGKIKKEGNKIILILPKEWKYTPIDISYYEKNSHIPVNKVYFE